MKEQYKWSGLHIAYYQQRVSKTKLLATFVELLILSSLSVESQQCLSIFKSYHSDFTKLVVSKCSMKGATHTALFTELLAHSLI